LLSQILLKRKQSIGRRGGRQEYATWFPPPSIYPKGGGFELINDRPCHTRINPFSRREENEN
jgi:hypothetical protein